MNEINEPYLVILQGKSILYDSDGSVHQYDEGKLSIEAKRRSQYVKSQLEHGYLEHLIKECYIPNINHDVLCQEHKNVLEKLVNSVTSEVGRAIVGLSVLQLTIKSLSPQQSIRLHKGSTQSGSFSWSEGIAMRVLDKNFITPVLRKYELLRLNADGFMMTRSLAENYPYSKLYKAAIKGGREEWLTLVDLMENGELDAEAGLRFLITQLIKKSESFKRIADSLLQKTEKYLLSNPTFEDIFKVICDFINDSTYSARILEIAMHSLFQALNTKKCLAEYLVPLSQMRSANKKHGNIGDIELSYSNNGNDIIESWDAKFGKTYLRDELEELHEKLNFHPIAENVGFVTDATPNLKEEIITRVEELEMTHNVKIHIVDFKTWVFSQIEQHSLDYNEVGKIWLIALVETICLKRRDIAPIDEPTNQWIEEFSHILDSKSQMHSLLYRS